MGDIDSELKKYKGLIHRVLRDFKIKDDYEDHFQELMIVLWQKLETYDSTRMAKKTTYLYNVLKNALIDIGRKDYKSTSKPRQVTLLEVVQVGEELKAYIDGRLYAKGDSVKGLAVIKVTKRSVVLECQGVNKTIRVGETLRDIKTIQETTQYNLSSPISVDDLSHFENSKATSDTEFTENLRTSIDFEIFLEALSEPNRKILKLKMEGHTQQEIADILGVSRQRIGTQLVALKDYYKSFISEGSD